MPMRNKTIVELEDRFHFLAPLAAQLMSELRGLHLTIEPPAPPVVTESDPRKVHAASSMRRIAALQARIKVLEEGSQMTQAERDATLSQIKIKAVEYAAFSDERNQIVREISRRVKAAAVNQRIMAMSTEEADSLLRALKERA